MLSHFNTTTFTCMCALLHVVTMLMPLPPAAVATWPVQTAAESWHPKIGQRACANRFVCIHMREGSTKSHTATGRLNITRKKKKGPLLQRRVQQHTPASLCSHLQALGLWHAQHPCQCLHILLHRGAQVPTPLHVRPTAGPAPRHGHNVPGGPPRVVRNGNDA